MAKPNILTALTYSMEFFVDTAMRSGVQLVLPRAAAFLGAKYNLPVVDMPNFGGSKTESATEFDKIVDQYDISAFWPLSLASYNLSHLNGAAVHAVCQHKTFAAVNDKVTFASWLTDSRYRPEGVETVGTEKTMIEIRARLNSGQQVCLKPPHGVNGGGFWIVDLNANLLGNPDARKIHPDALEMELRRQELKEGMERYLVMEMLTGAELSIDALCINGELLKWMIREKVASSKQIAYSDHEIMAHVRHIVKALGLHGIVSVQYMYDKDGNIKILEINLRPSGGCLAYGETIFGKAGTSDLLTDWLQYMGGLITVDNIQQWSGRVPFTTPPVAIPE